MNNKKIDNININMKAKNEISKDWYPIDKKIKNIRNKTYFADSCDLSRNLDKTRKSLKKIVKKDKAGFMPLSGSEVDYDPLKWNINEKDKENHNCYAYFLNHLIKGRPKRPQPGHRDPSINTFRTQDYTREEMTRRAIYDNPSLYCTHPDAVCEKGFYKGVLVVDRYNNYHWLVQNSNGYWSHKPGRLDVTMVDAKGNLIKDPREADLIYDKENRSYSLIYSDIGPFFCVPNPEKGAKVNIESHTCEMCGGGTKKRKSIKKNKKY